MVTAVDTSVLLDVLLNDPRHSGSSIAALRRAANEGSLVICETVLAEIVPTLSCTFRFGTQRRLRNV
jgi:predicted nucleic-acid-binding protein